MDAAITSGRLFPSYTTKELLSWLDDKTLPSVTRDKILAALAQRQSGSKPLRVPQVTAIRA